MNKLSFSGHEKFQCRQFWLKKGYDFVQSGNRFSNKDAVVNLGVGKNMVGSIRYWLKAFNMIDNDDSLSTTARYLLGKDGADLYLEDLGTIWLCHYLLVTHGRASIYSLVFNEFRRERIEFTKEQLANFLQRKCIEEAFEISPHTLDTDVDVFIKNYLRPKQTSRNIEDDFSGLLLDLELVQQTGKSGTTAWYKIESGDRAEIPIEIILYVIVDQTTGNSISFDRLLNDKNNVGMVFAMSANGLLKKIKAITQAYPDIVYTEDAGVRELQFKQKPEKMALLKRYYDR
ncbi:MAG: DUF4007 family protein [Deltaproteobacteria bacterium]|nr:DUF4007 family protein [Deltaproteobacteria bacterium]